MNREEFPQRSFLYDCHFQNNRAYAIQDLELRKILSRAFDFLPFFIYNSWNFLSKGVEIMRRSFVFFISLTIILSFLAPQILSAPPKEKATADEKRAGTAEIKRLDLTGITKEQEKKLDKTLAENRMTYCITKPIGELLKEEPQNPLALQLSQDILNKIKEGKSDKDILLHVKRTLRANRAMPPADPALVHDINIKNAPYRGPEQAAVTIVEFSDFQCPYCANLSKILNQVAEKYPQDVKHVFKNFPLGMHAFAKPAAKASLAAGAQGKFWEMRQKLFDNFRTINQENIIKYATELGLDMEKFQQALNDSKYDALVEEDLQDGELADVGGTPTIFINGKRFQGNRSVEGFEAAIKSYIAKPAP